MSSTISSTPSSASLASALLALSSQTNSSTSVNSNASSAINLDTLQLSGSSISDLESQAAQIASQNQNSVIGSTEEAFVVNLQAISALTSDPSTSLAAQSNQDASSALSLI